MSNGVGVPHLEPADVLHRSRRASFVENDREFQLNRVAAGAVTAAGSGHDLPADRCRVWCEVEFWLRLKRPGCHLKAPFFFSANLWAACLLVLCAICFLVRIVNENLFVSRRIYAE